MNEIEPDEIFLDSANLSELDESRLEGKTDRPLSRVSVIAVGVVFLLAVSAFSVKAYDLQIVHGDAYADVSRTNRLTRTVVFAARGVITDRTGERLAWNDIAIDETQATSTDAYATSTNATSTIAFHNEAPRRLYTDLPGLAHVLGFVQHPKRDASGAWWREHYAGVSGVEQAFDIQLRGRNGSRLTETDARGEIVRSHLIEAAEAGEDIALSIDAHAQSVLHETLSEHAVEHGFKGGAAVIMDVKTGELLALTNFPEYDNARFTQGDTEATAAFDDPRVPLLNRAISGLYAPGSIVKPMFAAAALSEGVISPEKEIHSDGSLSVPNPYDPEKPTIFRDWRAHGDTDMRHAIAVSSDVYFYTIGGGFGAQKGLGIEKLDEYAMRFGFGAPTEIVLAGEQEGVVPTPEWKTRVFGEDNPWRIGNTYHTAIGQFGFQVTPVQAARAAAGIASGYLVTPHLIASSTSSIKPLDIEEGVLQIVREGMRMAVRSGYETRTARALDMNEIEIAAKTGTAEVGVENEYMHSWVIGFWPASAPRYAFAVVLERAPAGTSAGAAPAMRPFFDWLATEGPAYLREPVP